MSIYDEALKTYGFTVIYGIYDEALKSYYGVTVVYGINDETIMACLLKTLKLCLSRLLESTCLVSLSNLSV